MTQTMDQLGTTKMAAFIDDDDHDFLEIAALYMNLFTPRRLRVFRDRANPLTDLDEVGFRAQFRVTKQCFVKLLTTLEPDLNHATESHGRLLCARPSGSESLASEL